MSDEHSESEQSTYSERHDPGRKVEEWMSEIRLARTIGTSIYGTLGRMLETDEVIALLCPQCPAGILLMHPVWFRAPPEEVVSFVKNEVETTRVMGLVCDGCRGSMAVSGNREARLSKVAVLNSEALLPLKAQGRHFQVVTIDEDDTSVGNINPEFVSTFKMALHVLPIESAGIHGVPVLQRLERAASRQTGPHT